MSSVPPDGPRILLVYPRFPAFHVVSFQPMVPFYPGRRAVMPPLGGCPKKNAPVFLNSPSCLCDCLHIGYRSTPDDGGIE